MVKAVFEHEDNTGLLTITTHFDAVVHIPCDKHTDEIFRLGGTAVNDVATYEGVILNFLVKPPESQGPSVVFRAFRNEEHYFEGHGILSPEIWNKADLHCYVTEYYPLNMEGKRPGWFISHRPLKDANYLFINLDVLDGGSNIIKRYRISPFTGEYRVLEYPLCSYAGIITGGENNIANGNNSTVSGDDTRTATGNHDWVAGSLFEDN